MKFLHGGKKLIFPLFSAQPTCSPRAAREEATDPGRRKKSPDGFWENLSGRGIDKCNRYLNRIIYY